MNVLPISIYATVKLHASIRLVLINVLVKLVLAAAGNFVQVSHLIKYNVIILN